MKTFCTKITLLLAIMTITLSACATVPPTIPDGEIVAVHAIATFRGIKSCLSGDNSTFILMRDNLVVFVWQIENGFAFVGINPGVRSGMDTIDQIFKGGGYTNPKTIGDLVDSLEKAGYEKVGPGVVPPIIWQQVGIISAWLRDAAASLTTFVFVPANAGSDFLEMLGVTGYVDS